MTRTRFLTSALVPFVLVLAAGTAPAEKLYTASWVAESFGNDLVGGSGQSAYFSVVAIPHGNLCNPRHPRCPFASTPVDASGSPSPIGPYCRPLTTGELPRPAKGATAEPGVPPLYRNPAFFTVGGIPANTACTRASTALGAKATQYLPPGDPRRGVAQLGKPLMGSGQAATTGGLDPVGFSFPAAPVTPVAGAGLFRTTLGSINAVPPYLYSYTYATLRNDAGLFGRGQGFFSVSAVATKATFKNKAGGQTVATVTVTPGASRFGGVMKLLGQMTTKACYFRNGGCVVRYLPWFYEYIGAQGHKNTAGSVVIAPYTKQYPYYSYDTGYKVLAQRFPWTTGTVTVKATGRGPHDTIEVRKGFDNRVSGVGTIQLVSPALTQWLGPDPQQNFDFETGGIAVLRLRFVPEPGVFVGLMVGLSLLGATYRLRSLGRRRPTGCSGSARTSQR